MWCRRAASTYQRGAARQDTSDDQPFEEAMFNKAMGFAAKACPVALKRLGYERLVAKEVGRDHARTAVGWFGMRQTGGVRRRGNPLTGQQDSIGLGSIVFEMNGCRVAGLGDRQ